MTFKVGQVYNRVEDIHQVYRGQRYGGIATPSDFPYVFIFTSDAGQQYGYIADGFREDGAFWYTGEGRVGDMQMRGGNLAIRDHSQNGKHLLLFEYVRTGYVRLIGEFEYLGHHFSELPDQNHAARKAIVFELGLIGERGDNSNQSGAAHDAKASLPASMTLAQLRDAAIKGAPPASDRRARQINVARRTAAVRRYALKRANGSCEGCSVPAPFQAKGGPFLEVHHVHRLGDGGPDHPAAVIALCPNCHRRAHYSIEGTNFNNALIEWLKSHESDA